MEKTKEFLTQKITKWLPLMLQLCKYQPPVVKS